MVAAGLTVAAVHFAAADESAPSPPDLTAAQAPVPASTSSIDLSFDGTRRAYELKQPGDGSAGPLPLVVVLHGAYVTGPAELARTGFGALAGTGAAVVVAPQSIGSAWNSSAGCCNEAAAQHVDDAGFVRAVIADAQRRAHTDPARTYVVGYSSGGKLAYALACSDAPALAAVATYGAGPQLPCPQAAPLTFVVGYGDHDTTEPMGGKPPNTRGLHQPLATTVAELRARDGCTATPTAQRTVGTAAVSTFGNCRSTAAVTEIVWHGSTHEWPGSEPGIAPEAGAQALFWPLLSAARRA